MSGSTNSSATEFAYDSPFKGGVSTLALWNSASGAGQPACGSVTGSGLISLSRTYDNYGNLTDALDGNGNHTHIQYDADSLYPTARLDAYGTALQRQTSYTFDSASGLIDSSTDYNGLTSTYSYDAVNRLTRLDESGAVRQLLVRNLFTYDDVNRRFVAYSDLSTPGDQLLALVNDYDQLGRPRLNRRIENLSSQGVTDDTAGIKIQTRYLSLPASCSTATPCGAYQLVSNPYRASYSSQAASESTMGWQLTRYDQNGRAAAATSYAGYGVTSAGLPPPFASSSASSTGTATNLYSATSAGATAQSIDEAGVSHTITYDGLGEIRCASEDGISSVTGYTYDGLGNLTGVLPGFSSCPGSVTGATTRSFTWDSLGRLLNASNPESGATSYGYDNNSNPISRTDALSTSCYGAFVNNVCNGTGYDALNRPTALAYNDGATPQVTFSWNGNTDFLSAVSSSVSSYAWTGFDALGRPGAGTQTTGSTSYTFSGLTWTPQSQLASITYPSGRVIAQSFDTAGRPVGLTGQATAGATPKTYASSATYAAHGGISGLATGSASTGDSGSQSYGYNTRLQVASASAANSSATLMSLGFGYPATANNGNVTSESISRGGFSATQTFYYDGVNRLCQAAEAASTPSIAGCGSAFGTGNNWQQSYAYDVAGNRAVVSNNAGLNSSLITPNYTPQVATYSPSAVAAVFPGNRWAGIGSYDGAGNAKAMTTQSMTYDAESRMTAFTDTNNMAPVSATFTYDGAGNRVSKTVGGVTTTYVYDPVGSLAAAYGGTTPPVTGTLYLTTDHLGSTRLVTSGGAAVGCHDYLPFGEDIPGGLFGRPGTCYGGTETALKFTGQEKDAESGFDHFPARYGSGSLGRFVTPDQAGNFVADFSNPQSWNMYSYVINRPLALIDPSGLDPSTCVNGIDTVSGVICTTVTGVGDRNGGLPCSLFGVLCGGGGGGGSTGGGGGSSQPVVTFTATGTGGPAPNSQILPCFLKGAAGGPDDAQLHVRRGEPAGKRLPQLLAELADRDVCLRWQRAEGEQDDGKSSMVRPKPARMSSMGTLRPASSEATPA